MPTELPIITPEEYATHLGVELSTLNEDRVTQLIELAGGIVRAEIRQAIDYVEDDEIELDGNGSGVLLLPELPVWDVTEVIETIGDNDTTLELGTHYRLENGHDNRKGILRRLPRPTAKWTDGSLITVTYSHGWDLSEGSDSGHGDLPTIIKAVGFRLVSRGYTNPHALRQRTIGRYSETAGGSEAGLYLTAGDKVDLSSVFPGVFGASR